MTAGLVVPAQAADVPPAALPRPMISQIAGRSAQYIGKPFSVRVAGNYAYVALGLTTVNRGLAVLDISHPGTPILISQSLEVSPAWGVDVAGQYAYLACRTRGANLQIVDIRDPLNPKRVGVYNGTGLGVTVTVSGKYAYLLCYEDFQVIDVSDPSKPFLVATAVPPRSLGAQQGKVTLHGNFAYVTTFGSLSVIDITDPAKPIVLPFDTRLAGSVYDIAFVDELAYLTYYESGQPVTMINMADPRLPVPVGRIEGVAAGNLKRVGNRLYARTTNALVGIDVSIPEQPRVVSRYFSVNHFHACDLDIDGDVACIAEPSGGIQVIDLRAPDGLPAFVKWIRCKDLAVANGMAYTASSPLGYEGDLSGLNIYEFADPAHPRRVGFLPFLRPSAIRLQGSQILLIDATGLRIIDASQPTKPVLRGSYPAPASSDAQLQGAFAYVANPTIGLEVVDLSDPTRPRQTGVYRRQNLRQVQVAGTMAYVTSAEVALQAIDVSDPANPSPRGNIAAGGETTALQVAAGRAYVAQGANVLVIDVREPWTPVLLGTYGSTNQAGAINRIQVADGLVFLARGSGLEILDATDPRNVAAVGGNTAVSYNNVQLAGNHLFLASDAEGLSVFTYDKAPRFSLFSIPADGAANLTVLNGTGRPFALEGSVNLKDWLVVTNVSAAEQTNRLVDPGARDAARRFYRVVAP